MRIIILFITITFLSSCGNGRKSKTLIPEKEFIDLLVDIHMFDAIGTDHTLNKISGDLDSLTLYTSIFNTHNTTRQKFEATMKWYSNNPELLSKLYDDIFGKITRMNQNWNDELELFSKNESTQLFKTSKYIDTRGDTVRYPAPFYIRLDSAGKYLVDLRIRMLEEDKSINPRIMVYLLNDTVNKTDSLEVLNSPIIKANFSRDYQYMIDYKDTNYKYMKIIVPQIDNDSNTFRKNQQLSSLTIYIVNND